MATDLEEKQGKTSSATQPDPGQAFYDREFSGITGKQNYSEDGTPGNGATGLKSDLSNAEKGASFLGKDREKSSSPSDLAATEAAGLTIPGGLYSGGGKSNFTGKVAGLLAGNRRKAMAGGFGGGAVGLILFFVISASGPAQLFRVANLLGTPLKGSENSSSIRVNALFRAAKSGQIGESRITRLGSLVLGKEVERLRATGIDFNSNRFSGSLNTTTFDTVKMAEKFPEMKSLNSAEARQAYLARQFNLKPGDFQKVAGGTKFAVNNRNFGIGANRIFLGDTLSVLGDGKIVGGMKLRIFRNFFNVPSLFHPMKRLSATAETRAGNLAQTRQREAIRKQRLESRTPVPSTAAIEAKARIKANLSDNAKNAIGGALLVTTVACVARTVADDVVIVNRAEMAIPAAAAAAQIVAERDQTQAMQDIDLVSIGVIVSDFTDANGNTVHDSKPFQALGDPYTKGGEDLSAEYKQSFSSDANAKTIKDTIGLGTVGAVACSGPGIILQFAVGLGAIIASIPSGGGSAALFYGAKTLASVVVTGGVIYMLEKLAVNALKNDSIIPTTLSGPVGGGLLAYGAQELASSNCRASGCVPVSEEEYQKQSRAINDTEDQIFREKDLFARMFDTKDSRSLASQTIGTMDLRGANNVASLASGVLTMRTFTSLFGSLTAPLKVSAAEDVQEPYEWGITRYAIPSDIMADPDYIIPQENAEKLATVLNTDSGQKYVDRALTCFGNTIQSGTLGWESVATDDVNPNDERYINAKCGDVSDPMWKRTMLFVNDSRNIDAIACYKSNPGDLEGDKSCSNNGIGNEATAAPVTDPTVPTGAAGTCEAGTPAGQATGYQNKQPVQITLCKVEGTLVNAQISGNLQKMLDAARAQNIVLRPGSGFRTMEEQRYLYNCYTTRSCNKGRKAAEPGKSNHQMGLAVDYSSTGGLIESRGTPAFQWLQRNAATYGFKNLPDEPWHWSIDGK